MSRTVAITGANRGIGLAVAKVYIVIALSPGWVRTDMGGKDAKIDPATSARGIVKTADALTMDNTSLWFTYEGEKRAEW